MKRIILFLLVLLSITTFTSCSAYNSRLSKSNIDFYYLRSSVIYNEEDGMICAEKRSVVESPSDDAWTELINLYLKGPDDDKYISPFPVGTELKQYSVDGETLTVILNNQISQLKGYDLTLACACLAKTILEIKPVHAVEIRAEGGRMGDFISVTMTEDNLLMLDNYSASQID